MTDATFGAPSHSDALTDAAIFETLLHPHTSLDETGFFRLATALTGLCGLASAGLVVAGIWPAAVFLVGNLAFLMLAMKVCRQGRQRTEHILIDDGGVSVRLLDRRSKVVHEGALPLFGLKLEKHDDPDFGVQSLAFRLRDRRLEVGRDLAPADREALSLAIVAAMRRAGNPIRLHRSTALALAADGA